ncbi:ATP-binding cassette domain-containing protein [Candidatus Methanomassiliicoccus intestinalis]|uniref:ATP-binding cassette domain-containing protein n=1 Tax=Candidatus Methanomassiliicoccus intestinalis TaxID=1406512 RepID=UPI0037DD52B1
MNSGNVIEIRKVSKTFVIDSLVKNESPLLQNKKIKKEKKVLDNISLEIKKGESIGLLGRNGSGKSTILKLLTKVMYPDSGEIEINGKVASILELGMGFHPELSGRENIYIKGSMYGFSEKEMDEIVDKTIQFSELGDQIDDPVRVYSSGMYARLAFAIAANVKCEIIIIDEILSVGDESFRSKCTNVFKDMKKEGKTIVLASHAMGTIENMCDRAVWLDSGKIREVGPSETVCYHYHKDMSESFDSVMKLAESGDSYAQNRIGVMYRDGNEVSKDLIAAGKWFEMSANAGFAEAQVNLADMLYEGNGIKKDIEKAIAWYTRAAELDNIDAQISLAKITGANLEQDRSEEMIRRLKDLAECGNLRAIFYYADALFRGIVVKQDRKEAMIWFCKAAEMGDVNAQFQLGINYRDGLGTAKDFSEAERWLTKAAENFHLRAKIELANTYRKGIGTERDLTKALTWYKEAALQGDANSMYQAAIMYRDGIGTNADQNESKRWLAMFANQNRLKTQFNMAEVLFRGIDFGDSKNEAIFWYQDAAEQGNVASAFQLGIIYRDGLGVEPNGEESIKWLKYAAERGHHGAMIDLGHTYFKGIGVPADLPESLKWYLKAAYAGNHVGRNLAGQMYYRGLGTEKDIDKAKKLFSLSAEFGNREAQTNILLDAFQSDINDL